jgi:hypothetical protein
VRNLLSIPHHRPSPYLRTLVHFTRISTAALLTPAFEVRVRATSQYPAFICEGVATPGEIVSNLDIPDLGTVDVSCRLWLDGRFLLDERFLLLARR